MYIIRADGNSTIGMGHIMRCLSIACAMKEQGCEPIFVTACKECIPIIEQNGFKTKLLTTDYREMEKEIPELKEIIGDSHESVILVDSYQVTDNYYLELRKFAHVACLEDMGQPYPVDMLINYNIYGPSLDYSACTDKGTITVLGASYMPLRQEFMTDTEYTLNDKITNVMITTGGSDPYFAAKGFTDAFLSDEDLSTDNITYHVISGPFNSHANELNDCYKDNSNVIIHQNVKSMKAIMKQCDVVLTATGSTIYEVSSLGVPMIVFYFAENQRRGAEALAQLTDIVNAGNYADNKENTITSVIKTLRKCVKDHKYCETLNIQEKQLVDGQGAARLAKKVIELTDKKGEDGCERKDR